MEIKHTTQKNIPQKQTNKKNSTATRKKKSVNINKLCFQVNICILQITKLLITPYNLQNTKHKTHPPQRADYPASL